MPPTRFQVSLPFGSGQVKNRFSRWRPWPSRMFYRIDFSYFWSTSHADASYQVSSQLAFGAGKESKNRCSRRPPLRPLPPSWISLVNYFSYCFDLQVTQMLSTKFQVSWSFGSAEEGSNTFSRRRPLRPSWNSLHDNFSQFWSTSHPDASTKFQDGRRSKL